MCYVRTKIKICRKCFSTFLIPSASFLQPSLISTVTFHLRITSRVFPSTHYRPVQDLRVSCIMGVNGRSKLLACDNTHAVSYYIHYIHDTYAVSDYVSVLHNTKFHMPLRLTIKCQLNKIPLMYQQLIIVYLNEIICSQFFLVRFWHDMFLSKYFIQ